MKRIKIDNFLKNTFSISNAKSVLDLGSGNGSVALYFAKRGANVDAIDKKQPPLLIKKHPRISFSKKTLEQWNASKEASYNLIILRNVLHFLPPKAMKRLLKEVKKALHPTGFVYISTMTPAPKSGRFLHNPKEILVILKPLILVKRKTNRILFDFKGKKYKHYSWQLLFRKISAWRDNG